MKPVLTFFAVLAASVAPLLADRAADLEAKLKETTDASASGAQVMIELADLYSKSERVFDLIRTTSRFSRAQTDHPQRASMTVKLMKGYAAAARHEDVIVTGRQFLEIFPGDKLTNEVRALIATAYEHTGRPAAAANQREAIWENGGAINDGIRGLQLLIKANTGVSFQRASDLATRLVSGLTKGPLFVGVAFEGMNASERSEQWANGLQIAKALSRSKSSLTKTETTRLWYSTGLFEARLGQFENAIISLRKALVPGRDDIHRTLIDTLINASRSPSSIEEEAQRYLAAYPRREDRYAPLMRAAEAAANAQDLSRALAITEEVMREIVPYGDLPRSYVRWCGENHRQAEEGLLRMISRKPTGVGVLRAVLALDVYRDRMKDLTKARAVARDFLSLSPTEDGWVEEITAFLYDTASGPETFRKNLDLISSSAVSNAHLGGFQDRIWKRTPRDKGQNKLWQGARKAHQNNAVVKLWKGTRENGGKSAQCCQKLLQQTKNSDHRYSLLARLAYVYRHHLGGKSRASAAKHYETLCREFPKDFEAAELWLEASSYVDEKERVGMKVAAAKHLLSQEALPCHPDTWYRLVEHRNQAVITKAIPWIKKSASLSPTPVSSATRIGDVMHELGMKEEAQTWWKSRMDLDPTDRESVSCALRVASSLETGAAISFLRSRLTRNPHHEGAYTAELANLFFRGDQLEKMESVLLPPGTPKKQNPFQSNGMGEWPARTWLDTARNAKDWSAEKKNQIYRLVQSLDLGRLSSEAGLALLALKEPSLDRLLEAQSLIETAGPHHESWRRIYPYAQAALAREDFTFGAAILNGLLNTIRSVGQAETTAARNLLRSAYGKLGTLGADIPPDSPIAPLLQIILHLRLGDNQLAEQAYYQNRKLFDEHRNEIPVELLLFAAQTHIDQGTPEDHERVEDLLRGWLVKFSESEKTDVRDKSRVQLLLARNYQRARQFDIARAEFTTLLNLYKNQPEEVEARFGIGETYMAQKVYDQAGEIFGELAENPNPSTALRANFLRGVLAIRQDDNEQARKIFLAVLEEAPDPDLANETLFNLAEVYGIEQRFLTQLETLRTVGRLGQDSKLWHTPGTALSVVVQDPDLGISRGNTRIPVVVRTDPGNDVEESFLTSGGAGKGIFLTEFPTILGVANQGDGVLQITGGDVILVDYPTDFKEQFQFNFLSNTRLRIASDGSLEVASSEIKDQNESTFTDSLQEESEQKEPSPTRASARPKDQIKPGNLIYLQVKDGDRDLSAESDQVAVKLTASSGDEVQLMINEEGVHGGVFSGNARTGELPAGARASDSALDHQPLMAIDHSMETAWRSEPNGAAPKSLSVDMKELRTTDSIVLNSPQAAEEAPVRMTVRGSHDGRFWFDLASFPTPDPAPSLTFPEKGMNLRVYKTPAKNVRDAYTWKEIVDMARKLEPDEITKVETLSWSATGEEPEASFLIWSGPFVQERPGALRIEVPGQFTAVMFNEQLVLPVGEGGRSLDLFAPAGIHALTIFSIAPPETEKIEALFVRENPQSSSLKLRPFSADDFDVDAHPALQSVPSGSPAEIVREENRWTLSMPPLELRYLDFDFLEYRGEAISINHVEVSGGGTKHIPPAEDVLALAGNDTLEVAPGDTVKVSYLDEITAGGAQRNRLRTQSLTATYHNGEIIPIGYDFSRKGDGSVSGSRKELLRIEPGDRIVAEVVDFDLDEGLERDEVRIEVQVNNTSSTFYTAIETGPSTGVFHAEIETTSGAEPGAISVKAGDKIYLRYEDARNTFPGHAVDRETVVLLNEPTEARIQIVESLTPAEGSPQFIPVEGERAEDYLSKIEYRLPLSVEVIDPDQALNTSSTVLVDVTTTAGARVQVECVLSRALAPPDDWLAEVRNPALREGRFVGQIPLLLGSPTGATIVPADGSLPAGGIGRVIPPTKEDPGSGLIDGADSPQGILAVLPVLGTDTLTANYQDLSRPDQKESGLSAAAVLHSAATLAITDSEYLEDAEIVYVGKKLFLRLADPDRDISDDRDKALVRVVTETGEDEMVELEETLSHSGVFSGSVPLLARSKPEAGNFEGNLECFFGDQITAGYLDNVAHPPEGEPLIEKSVPVAVGTDGIMAAFSKVYKDEDLAIQTQFHIAESYFELFKSQRSLEHPEEAAAALASGRRILRDLQEDYPNPKYAPRVSYLLGQFAQEMEAWDEAIAAYGGIVRNHPEHSLAPDAQYKLGQCHEEAGEMDKALEAYVTLAGTYPKSPLIANVMLRINEHFYVQEDYAVAASVGGKFLERFPNHEWTPKMAFRIGQCHYKQEDFLKGGQAFDAFVRRFPDQELTAQALFWAGESYRMGRDIPNAFRRYNRCRWDFPESDAAKYSRGRLALPELLAQFEKEANLNE